MRRPGAQRSTPFRWRAELQLLPAAPPFAWMLAGALLVVLAQACGESPPVDATEPDAALAADADVALAGSDADPAPDAATDGFAPDVADAPDADAADPVDAASDAVADASDAATDAQSPDVADAAVDVSPADALADDATADAAFADAGDAATDADDAVPQCTLNSDCAAVALVAPCQAAVCSAGACKLVAVGDGTPCEDGDACTHSDVCLNGQCTDGVALDCDDGQPCTVDTCAQGGCVHAPASGPCEDGNVCTLGDSCKGGACVSGQTMDCEDGNVCTDNTCNPTTGCVQLPNVATCTLLDLCQSGATCGGGTCHAGPSVVCADGDPCTNDLCDPQTGLCEFLDTTNPCDDGNACTLGDLCQGGQCQPGADKPCDDGSPCTADACDPASGACLHTASTGSCSDGDACTIGDTCAGGVCLPGVATTCADANPCTDDTCDAKIGCSHANNTLACSVGDACELAQCQAGQCVTTGVKGCDDGNPCTVGTCIAPVGCVFVPVVDGKTCSAANGCAGAATCVAGKCGTGAKVDCTDGNTCTDDYCDPKWVKGCYWLPNVAACEDGDLCTGQDVCNNGKCLPGTLTGGMTNCDDANVCTDDSCAATTGCVHVANSAACDDGNACTIFEKCTSGVCQGGALATCEDGNSCTIDVCAPGAGTCSWYAKQGNCDDGNPCTFAEQCVGAFCVGTAVNCDDANPCSADACDVTTGVCGHTVISVATPCNDGDACTNNDACAGMTCSGVSIAASLCSDGNVCTSDVCNPADGTCSWTAAASPCDDGNPCTVGDACAASACVSGSGALCNDNNACTLDQCNPAGGACTYGAQPNGTACDDGIACTASSACQSGFCAPAVANCPVFKDAFTCGGPLTGWSLPQPTDTKVIWAIDQTPALSNSSAYGCMLNYNDGLNYCGSVGFYCMVQPTLVATSPIIDATGSRGMPRLAFDTWYQLDGPLPGGTGFGDGKTDVPLVVLRDVASNQILDQFLLSKSTTACNGQCQSVWRFISLDEPKVAGHAFRMELSLASPSNWGNQGKGWFIDNIAVTREFVPETCSNGVDDDGNGRVDCADPVCAGQPGC